MTWWGQLIVGVIGVLCFLLLLNSNRRQDAMQNGFLLGMLLTLGSIVIPETILYLPIAWWGLFSLRAANFRTLLASVLGILVVGLYSGLFWFIFPTSPVVEFVQSTWIETIQRSFGILSQPLWIVILTCLVGVVGFIYQIAHLRKYNIANVKIQTRFLLSVPFYWLSLLSCLFPTTSGNCLMLPFWIVSINIIVLYILTYGFPRINNPFKHNGPTIRAFSRRTRRRK